MIRALYLLFVLSGAAGLIYESIWTRYLGLFVGHGAYAQIIVLAIFLGGMSVGASSSAAGRSGWRTRSLATRSSSSRSGCIGFVFHDIFVAATAARTTSVFPAWPGRGSLRRRQVDDRRAAHPAAVDPPRRNLPAHERGRAAAVAERSRAARSRSSTSRTASAARPACSSRDSGCSARWAAGHALAAATVNFVVSLIASRRAIGAATPAADGSRPKVGASAGRSRRERISRPASATPAAGRQLRHRGRVVHLRDRVDPDARRCCSAARRIRSS